MYHCYSYDEVEAKKGMRISETSPTPTTNYSAGMNNTTKKTPPFLILINIKRPAGNIVVFEL